MGGEETELEEDLSKAKTERASFDGLQATLTTTYEKLQSEKGLFEGRLLELTSQKSGLEREIATVTAANGKLSMDELYSLPATSIKYTDRYRQLNWAISIGSRPSLCFRRYYHAVSP